MGSTAWPAARRPLLSLPTPRSLLCAPRTALLTGDVVVLLVIGCVFVAVALSVIVQLAYYHRTGGRRPFRASPLHHHFEMCGWPESRIVHRFWLVGAVAAVVGVGLALKS